MMNDLPFADRLALAVEKLNLIADEKGDFLTDSDVLDTADEYTINRWPDDDEADERIGGWDDYVALREALFEAIGVA